MKAQNMFYALTVLVDDDTVDEVMQDDWLESIAQETLFCVCARKNGISDEASHRLRRSIVEGRMETGKPVLLLDWDGDVSYLNQRISEHMVFRQCAAAGLLLPPAVGLKPQIITKKRPCTDGIIVTGSFVFRYRRAAAFLQDVMVEHRDRQIGDDKAVGAHAAKHPRDQDPHQRAGKKLADGACLAGADVRGSAPGRSAQKIEHR